ncbi:nucleotide sugar dehydrogenase [Candidatus Pelagibacter sp.]|nr:nucleotide sugar dehydrogenase [Candidatus Pelagibacter sp.]
MKKNKIGFVGASHLGICSAIAAAEKNFNIILYDTDLKKINDLKKFKIDFYEPDVEKFIKKNKKKILFSNDPKSLKDCEIIYISHDTPTNNSNVSNYNFIENLISKTTKYLNKNSIMVIMCQAYPGFTEKIKWKKEKLFYQVETLIFGKAIQRAINPEQIIIGKSYNCKKKTIKTLENFIKKFSKNIKYMSYKSSELSKIAINLYLSSSITYANAMAELCEKIGASWSEIEEILRKDKRIGAHAYLKPGLGILSGNLQRDIVISEKLFKKTNSKSNFISSIKRNSDKRKNWILDIINNEKIKKGETIGVFGSTYKENISTLKNSPLINIVKKLKKFKFVVYDPVNDLDLNIKNVKVIKKFNELLKSSKILIILTPWSFIKNKKNQKKLINFKGRLIIDIYNVVDKKLINEKIKKLAMGK